MCMTFGRSCGGGSLRPRTVAVAQHPRVEPITLTEAKEQLRIFPEYAEDDPYVQALISAARRVAEESIGFCWAVRQYRAKVCGCIGCGCSCGCNESGIELPNPPVLIDADHPVTVETPDGTVPPEDFDVDPDRWPALLVPRRGWRGPAVVHYWAGVPHGGPRFEMARTGCLQLIAHWYRNRESVSELPFSKVPQSVDFLFGLERQTWRL